MKLKMKSLLLAAMVLSLPLIFSSCSSDDDNDAVVNNSIIGTWKFDKTVAGEIKTNSADNDEKTKTYLLNHTNGDYKGSELKLSENGIFMSGENGKYDDSDTGTYTFKDGILTLDWGGGDIYNMKASIIKGVLIVEEDWTEKCNNKSPQALESIGITDVNYHVTKAIVNSHFVRIN